MPDTETRHFRAAVRKIGSIGGLEKKDFACEVPITGSYHRMAEAAIAAIQRQGYETHHIVSHSLKPECL